MIKSKVKDGSIEQMGQYTRETLKTIKFMARELRNGKMDLLLKEIITKVRNKVKVSY